jgi:hypothetical protein
VILLVVAAVLLFRPAWQRQQAQRRIIDWGGTIYELVSASELPTETRRQRMERSYWRLVERLCGSNYADSCERVEFSGTLATDEDLLFVARCTDLRSIFVNNADVGDRFAAVLAKLPRLYTVDLEGTRLTDAGLERLSACQTLRQVNVTETYATLAGVAKFQAALPEAEIRWGTSVSDAHWHAQRQLARNGVNLEAEGLRFGSAERKEYACTVTLGTGNVYLDEILPLKDLVGNIRLRCIHTTCPPDMCAFLGSLSNIGLMSLAYVAFEDLDWISNMQNLYDLRIEFTVGKNHDLSFLSRIPNLRRLELRRIRLRDEDILRLAAEMQLERLLLREAEITDKSLVRITRFKRLQRLDLSETAITDAGAMKLAELERLEWLELTQTSIGDDAMAAIASLPHLEVLYLDRTNVTAAGLQELAGTKTLTHLTVAGSNVGVPPPEVRRQFDWLESFDHDRADDADRFEPTPRPTNVRQAAGLSEFWNRSQLSAGMGHSQPAVNPPSTKMVWPVRNAAAGEARKIAVPTMSAGRPRRRNGVLVTPH